MARRGSGRGRGRAARRLAGTRGHGAALLGGVALAGGAAAFVRAFPGWFDGGLSAVLLFAATAALTAAGVFVVRFAARPGGLADLVGTVAASALLADGLLLAFAPGLYGGDEVTLRHAGAWLLFGGGTAMGFAVLLETRAVER